MILAFAFSAIAGSLFGFNGVVSGAMGVGAFALAKTPSGSLAANGFDISEIVTQLGDYYRKYSTQIWQDIYNRLEFENYMTAIPGITSQYVATSSSVSDILQPFQGGFTPKGSVTFTPRINEVKHYKVDYLIDSMDDWYTTYLGDMMTAEGTERAKWPLVKYIWMEKLIPKIAEEMDLLSAQGVYAAPTPPTPGSFMDICDGVLTNVATEITAGNITPINTGVITAANILDRVEFFADSLPNKYKNAPIPLFMSGTNARRYQRDYRNEFGSTNDQRSKDNLAIDATNIQIIGLNSFEGSDRFLMTPKGNLLKMFNKISILNNFTAQEFNRDVKLLADGHRGYGFVSTDVVFVNDQA